jgi:hypothetical protein
VADDEDELEALQAAILQVTEALEKGNPDSVIREKLETAMATLLEVRSKISAGKVREQ